MDDRERQPTLVACGVQIREARGDLPDDEQRERLGQRPGDVPREIAAIPSTATRFA